MVKCFGGDSGRQDDDSKEGIGLVKIASGESSAGS